MIEFGQNSDPSFPMFIEFLLRHTFNSLLKVSNLLNNDISLLGYKWAKSKSMWNNKIEGT